MKISTDKANKQLNSDYKVELQSNVFLQVKQDIPNQIYNKFTSHKRLSNKKVPNNYYYYKHICPSTDTFNGAAFNKTSKFIHEASLQCGYEVTRNGRSRKIKGNSV